LIQRLAYGYAPIHGAQLYYDIHGSIHEPADGPIGGRPLLLVHAGVADLRMWDAQLPDFAREYRVIRLDLRGFGRTAMPGGSHSNHADLRGLLDYLDVGRAHVVGLSFGGRVALDFALSYPDRLDRLVLASPSVGGEPLSKRLETFAQEEEAALERGDLVAATELNVRLWVDGPFRTADEVDPAVRAAVYAMQLAAFQLPMPADAHPERLAPPAIERLAQVHAPVLVLAGALDLPEKIELAQRLAEELPTARLELFAGAAHMINMEQPARFNQAVLAFLDGDDLAL
jgi:pimeloyl-ACP methyl ester carboxylesterase